MSGWKEIEEHLKRSSATTIRVLLGQAFFQTEPQLLLRIKGLQQSNAPQQFDVKLASAIATFHPKIWIIDNDTEPFGVVGSANLSRGGLLSNVECGIFTNGPEEVKAPRDWFDGQWASAPPFAETCAQYITKYHLINAKRKLIDAQIEAATNESRSSRSFRCADSWNKLPASTKFGRSAVRRAGDPGRHSSRSTCRWKAGPSCWASTRRWTWPARR